MQQELNKAQQLARKYHQMYDMERRRNGVPEGAHSTPEPEINSPRANNNASSFLGQNVRVNDVIRKNEVLFGGVFFWVFKNELFFMLTHNVVDHITKMISFQAYTLLLTT